MKTRFQRTWEQVSTYLPVLLMGLLASGSWWLVRNAPKAVYGPVATLPSDMPDYTLRNFSIQQFDAQGQFRSEIHGTMARHYPATENLEVDQVRIRSVGEDGAIMQSSALRGISNADGSEVQLWGSAKVQRSYPPGRKAVPDMVLESEFLHAWTLEERVQSHLPVVLRRGADQFSGNRMTYDNLDQVLVLKGRVKGTLQPGTTTVP